MNELTKLARIPLMLLDFAEQLGLDRASLMAASSLRPGDLEDPDSRVPLSTVLRLWRELAERTNDPAVGIDFGRSIMAKQIGLIGYAIYHSADLLEAAYCMARYQHIISDAVVLDVGRGDSTTVYSFSAHPSVMTLKHPIEAAVVATVIVGRELTGQNFVPLRVELPFTPDAPSRAFRDAIGLVPEFDAETARVTFSNEVVELPIREADPVLAGYLTQLAEEVSKFVLRTDNDFVRQVRRALWSMLPHGKPDLWHTASKMDISARTLQRRLREEGSSFSAVLEGLRQDLSEQLLADRTLAVADVAFLLGYSEPSAFQRAFRRWRGTSPRAYRTH